jgi:hypothetical protein
MSICIDTHCLQCYLKRNLEKFDGAKMVSSLEHVKAWLAEIQALPKPEQDKEGDTITMLEMLIELYSRGVKILPVDVYESAAEDFATAAASPRPVVVWMRTRYPARENTAAASNSGPRGWVLPATGLTIKSSFFIEETSLKPPYTQKRKSGIKRAGNGVSFLRSRLPLRIL